MKKLSNIRDKQMREDFAKLLSAWVGLLDMAFPDYNNQKLCLNYPAISILQSEK